MAAQTAVCRAGHAPLSLASVLLLTATFLVCQREKEGEGAAVGFIFIVVWFLADGGQGVER